MKRENAVGRANVEDTPELAAYYRELEKRELGALWNVANEIEPYYPQPKSVPMLWKWRDIGPLVRKAPELVTAEKAARRVVMLVNPGRKEWSAAAGLLYTGVQIMNPGEFTSAHRHHASALRFVMEGTLSIAPHLPPSASTRRRYCAKSGSEAKRSRRLPLKE